MKKLFLLTLALTFLCTWSAMGANTVPNATTLSDTQGSAISSATQGVDQEVQVQKKAVEPQDVSTVLNKSFAPASRVGTMPFNIEEKPAYNGPANKPDQHLILQGGDDCAGATAIGALPYSDNGTTSGYADNYDEVCPYSGSTSPDVVYSYSPAADGGISLTLCIGNTDYDTKMYVYEDDCIPGTAIACNDDACSSPAYSSYVSRLDCVAVFAGHTYYIVIDGWGGDFGNYFLDADVCEPVLPPPNDNCQDVTPVEIPAGSSHTFNGNDCGATVDCGLLGGPPEAWEAFTITEPLPVLVDYCGSNSNRTIFYWVVIPDCPCSGYILRDTYNYTDCADGMITFGFNLLPAGTYYVPTYADPSQCGDYVITVQALNPPTGACCVDGQCVATNTQPECDGLGGVWYQGEDCDAGFQCPLSLPCWDAVNILYDNGDTDGSNGYSMYEGIGRTMLDDFVVPDGGMTITDFHQSYLWNTLPPGSGTGYILNIWDDAGGSPGSMIGSLNTILVSELPTGRSFFSRAEAVGNVAVEPTFLDAGTYWIEFTVQGPENCFAMIHALSNGQECWLNWADYGYFGPASTFLGASPADVNFCLSGDAAPTGACCDEDTGNCTDNVSVWDCAYTRFVPNTLCADLNPPCGEQPPCSDFTVDAPGTWTGNTCGAGNDCALRSSEEVIYEVNIPNDGLWVFQTCGSSYDTYIFLGTTCCGQEIGYNDDAGANGPCAGTLQSYLAANLSAGTYYLTLEGYSGCGAYVLNVYQPTGACCVGTDCVGTMGQSECDNLGGTWYEGEDCDAGFQCPVVPDNDNCDDVTPVELTPGVPVTFTGNDCNATVDCPLLGGPGEAWEAFTINEDLPVVVDYCNSNSNRTIFYWVVVTDCPCSGYILRDTYNYTDCPDGMITFGFNMLPAGTYYIPTYADPGQCGDYVITVEALAPPTGACCVDLECVATNTHAECDGLGGDWYSGQDCDAGFECPAPPVETCTDASYWDNGDHDGVNGIRPTANWDPLGMIDDFQLEEETNITCMRAVFIDLVTPPDQPSGILSARLRIYDAPNGIYGLSWPVDGENPLYDFTYTGDDFNEIDLGYDEFGGDVIAYDLCTPDGVTLPAGNYGAFLNFPGIGPVALYWGSAPAIGNDISAVWGPSIPDPSPNSAFADLSFHFGVGDCAQGSPCGPYVVGDYNGSGAANVADVVDMFSKLKTGSPSYPALDCECPPGGGVSWPVRADVNASCTFNVADVVGLFSFLKTGGPIPVPCPACPPGSPRLGGDQPLVRPTLESKAKISTQQGAQ